MDQDAAKAFLSSLLNKKLRVFTTDGRLFWGSLKCTDADMNVILAQTCEYRKPSTCKADYDLPASDSNSIAVDMTSRYLGLVVIPGRHIVKMEVEESARQDNQSPT